MNLTDLMKKSVSLVDDVVEGKLSPAASSAAARHIGNVAKLMDLRCKYGEQVIEASDKCPKLSEVK